MAATMIKSRVLGDRKVLERVSSAALSPGHIIEIVAAQTCKKSTYTANQPRYIALNYSAVGQAVDTAYASGDLIQIGVFLPGDEVWVMAPTGLTIALEAVLYLDGAGRVTTVTTNAAFCRAKAAYTTSGDTLVLVELL